MSDITYIGLAHAGTAARCEFTLHRRQQETEWRCYIPEHRGRGATYTPLSLAGVVRSKLPPVPAALEVGAIIEHLADRHYHDGERLCKVSRTAAIAFALDRWTADTPAQP